MISKPLIHQLSLLLAFLFSIQPGRASLDAEAKIESKGDTKITYALTIKEPESGDVEVSILVENAPNSDLEFVLPCWAPGRFIRDDFAGLVSQEEARLEGGEAIPISRPSSHLFRIAAGGKTALFRYRAYAGTASPGTSAVEARGALINPASLLPYLREARDAAVEVYLTGPENWRWASSLPSLEGPGHFAASDWNELAESVILGGSLSEQMVEQDGQKIRLLALCADDQDDKSLRRDFQTLTSAGSALFGELPRSEATIFVHALNSEAQRGFRTGANFALLVAQPQLTDRSPGQFAAATAGLYFGASLQPRVKELGNFEDLPMRDDLWLAPSFLGYLGLQLIYRSGSYSEEALLQEIAGRIEAGESEVAARQMSLAEAAQRMALLRREDPRRLRDDQADDWIDPNLRGEILAALLDFQLHALDEGKLGLVTLLKAIKKADEDFSIALFREHLEKLGGRQLSGIFDRAFTERRSPIYAETLAAAGFRMETSTETAFLGLKLDGDRIMTVRNNSAGARAGLQSRDRILRIGGSSVGEKAEERIASMPAGTQTTMTIERRGRLITLPITVDTLARRGWTIVPESTSEKEKIRASFFGHEVPE